MNNNDYIDNLIALVLSAEATPEQFSELEQWKLASSENMEYFRQMKNLFDAALSANIPIAFNSDKAWEKLQQEIRYGKNKPVVRTLNLSKKYYDIIRIAAMLLLVAGIGFAVYKVMNPTYTPAVFVESGEQVKELTTPDSTHIVLNRNTSIEYAYNHKRRVVKLNGEAYFDIANHPAQPFEVLAGGIIIRDIGTSFNVRAIEKNDSLVVNVTNGEVQMSTDGKNFLILKKGEEGIYLKSRDEFIKMAIADTNAIAYKTKIFVFENASLQTVAQKLSEVYNVNIVVAATISNCHLTATFKNESVDAIIDIIVETLQLKLIKDQQRIILDGTGCEQ